MKSIALSALSALLMLAVTAASAKLPAASDDAKAKAAEAAAKTAHAGKVDNYKLCLAMDQVAAGYYANAKKAGKEAKPPATTAACADPGAFVYPAPAAAAPAAVAPPAVATAPAAAKQ